MVMDSKVGNNDWKIGSVEDVIQLGEDNPSEVIIFYTNELRLQRQGVL
jgi:hypothetical protein